MKAPVRSTILPSVPTAIFCLLLGLAIGICSEESEHIKSEIFSPIKTNFDASKPSKYDLMPEDEFSELVKKLENSTGAGVQVHAVDHGPGDPDNCSSISYTGNFDPNDPEDYDKFRHDLSVCSIIKGYGFSLAPEVELHYYGVNHGSKYVDEWLKEIYEKVDGPAVVSISLSTPKNGLCLSHLVWQRKCSYWVRKLVQEKGVVVLVAAGNNKLVSEPDENLHTSDGLWKIGALAIERVKREDSEGSELFWDVASFSNHGPWVTYYALGTALLVSSIKNGSNEGRQHSFFRGTSAATPLVACLVALIRSVDTNATVADTSAIINRMCTRVSLPDGHGGTYDAKILPILQHGSFPQVYRRTTIEE